MENCEEITKAKKDFLKYEFFMLSWNAAVEHKKIWPDDWTEDQKKNYKKEIKAFLVEKMDKNKSPDEEVHIQNIKELQEKCEKLNNKLNIGTCQKLLNMMCKYYWCAGWIEEPPHLPIDSINLSNIGDRKTKWTKINDDEQYKELIEKFKEKIPEKSLAVWELKKWKRKNDI